MRFNKLVLASAFVGSMAIGCGGVEGEVDSSQSADGAGQLLSKFRGATSIYKNVANAEAAGFVRLQEPCFAEEWSEGDGSDINLGVVYVRPSHMDANLDAKDPEVLYYEPQADGSLELMGGEYFCPEGACNSPPTLLGFTFRHELDVGGYALHTWGWLDNPNGLTHPINPNVDTTYCAGCSHPGEEVEECHSGGD
jgi:hypothetical protein